MFQAALFDPFSRDSLLGVELKHLVNQLIEGGTIKVRNVLYSYVFLLSDQFLDTVGLIRHLIAAQFIN